MGSMRQTHCTTTASTPPYYRQTHYTTTAITLAYYRHTHCTTTAITLAYYLNNRASGKCGHGTICFCFEHLNSLDMYRNIDGATTAVLYCMCTQI